MTEPLYSDLPGLLSRSSAVQHCQSLQQSGKTVVFTNGSFDLLHLGHLQYLQYARSQGDCLVVGLNSDQSVQQYKSPERPIVPELERAQMLLGLKPVDYVVIFNEEEPKALIEEVLPNILVKGEDWAHYVSGREAVEANGGQVVLAPLVEGRSTTNIIKKILSVYGS